jgi:hypothetical protein
MTAAEIAELRAMPLSRVSAWLSGSGSAGLEPPNRYGLPNVSLADALSRLLLALDQQPWRFETAALLARPAVCRGPPDAP